MNLFPFLLREGIEEDSLQRAGTLNRNSILSILFFLLTSIVLVSACSSSGAALVQSTCSECHSLAPIEVSSKSYQEWERTVERMRQLGAKLTDRQAEDVIQYLSETYGSD